MRDQCVCIILNLCLLLFFPQPQNVLLDKDGRAKIADFGISRFKVGTAASHSTLIIYLSGSLRIQRSLGVIARIRLPPQ